MTAGEERNPNLAILTRVANALGDLLDSLVFIGGCATGLLITAVRAQQIRVTRDVDVVAEVSSLREYHRIEDALRARGFVNDTSEGAPICRWIRAGIELDVMPSEPDIVAFHNDWYPLAVRTATPFALPSGTTLNLIAAPVFIATKLEAFKGRGESDYMASHDMEDIVSIIDGRPELTAEVQDAPAELKAYLASQFKALLIRRAFVDSLSAHLPGDEASQGRLPLLLERIRLLARNV